MRGRVGMKAKPSALRDFTVNRRVWLLTGVALLIGVGAAGLAVVLLAHTIAQLVQNAIPKS